MPSFRSDVLAGASLRERVRSHAAAQDRGDALRLELPASPFAPASARSAIRVWSAAVGLHDARRETLALLVSELVSNAVRHAQAPERSPIVLAASFAMQTLRVAVTDAGSGFVPRPRDPTRVIGGYGLEIVRAESRRWGVDGVGGTRVWFEL